ncbi:SH3 domain-containing protein [Orbaceae bacterium ac157xtp]
MIITKKWRILFAFIISVTASFSVMADDQLDDETETALLAQRYYDFEMKILRDLLRSRGYILPNAEDFKRKCYEYFFVDVNYPDEDYDEEQTEERGNHIFTDYSNNYIPLGERFLYTFDEPVDHPMPDSATPSEMAELEKEFKKDSEGVYRHFVAYNKLLFNDVADTEFFIKNPKWLKEVVFNFKYEKNNFLYEKALTIFDVDEEKIFYILFYNEHEKGYRARLINDLYKDKGIEEVKQLLSLSLKKWEKYNRAGELKRNTCLLHLIKIVSQHQDSNSSLKENQRLAYEYLTQFGKIKKQFIRRFGSSNYYEKMGLLVDHENQKVISVNKPELLENIFETYSKDNYINVRASPSSKSKIIKQLPNQYKVTKLKASGKWYYVKLSEEDLTGYIHMSQLEYVSKKRKY